MYYALLYKTAKGLPFDYKDIEADCITSAENIVLESIESGLFYCIYSANNTPLTPIKGA
jgi:hypothetical protein